MKKYPSQTQDKFTVRFPDGMRDEIAARAERNGRSMNSEIVQILDDALNGRIRKLIEEKRKSRPSTHSNSIDSDDPRLSEFQDLMRKAVESYINAVGDPKDWGKD